MSSNEQPSQQYQGRNKKRGKNNAYNPPQYVGTAQISNQFTPAYQPYQGIQQNGFQAPNQYPQQIQMQPIQTQQMPILNNQLQMQQVSMLPMQFSTVPMQYVTSPMQMQTMVPQNQNLAQNMSEEEEESNEPIQINEEELNQRLNDLKIENQKLHEELDQQKEKIQDIQNLMFLLYTRLARFDTPNQIS